jgi:PAS domain S-box-containing protein
MAPRILIAAPPRAGGQARSRLLHQAGFEVLEAAGPEDAVRLARATLPRLIVLDVGLNGAGELRSRLLSDRKTACLPILDLERAAEPVERGADELALAVGALLRLQAEAPVQGDEDARWRGVAEHAPILIWMSGIDKQAVYFNRSWLDFTGRTLDQELGAGWTEGVHAEERERRLSTYERAFDARTGFEVEYRLQHRDGGYRWVLDCGAPRYRPDGAFAGYIGSCVDITPRKFADEALRASEQRFRALIEHSNDVICVCDAHATITFLSASVQRICGRDPRDILFRNAFTLMHPRDAAAIRQTLRQTLADPSRPLSLQLRYRHPEGMWRWLEGTMINQLQETGIHGVVVNLRDITERKRAEVERERLLQAEKALREAAEAAERRSALLAETSEALAATLDYHATLAVVARKAVPLIADCCVIDIVAPDGGVQQVARACAYAPVQEIFEHYAAFVPTRESVHHPVLEALATGLVVVVEQVTDPWMRQTAIDLRHLTQLRRLSPRALFVVPLVAYGQRVGTLSFLLVDPLRRIAPGDVRLAQEMASRMAVGIRNAMLYAEAERLRAEAEAASRIKDEFLATVSHELRQPVHAISGWLRLLKSGKLTVEKQAHALDTIEQNTSLQAQIVNDLLDVSAMITGQLQLQAQAVDLKPVIDAAVETLRPAVEAKELRLEVLAGDGVGPLAGDPKRLQQVMWNLLSNAVKFTPRGGRVEIRLMRADRHAEIRVSDTGPGIKPEFLPYVFDRFRQEDSTTTRKHGGLGLGLAIVRHLMELHGGTVEAFNAESGQGAVFVLRLPLLLTLPRAETDPDGHRRHDHSDGVL